MSNLVKRLRYGVDYDAAGPEISVANRMMDEAADRLEALEAALRQARDALTMVVYDLVPSDPADRVWSEARRSVAAINDLLKD
jgi:hypothetical protein